MTQDTVPTIALLLAIVLALNGCATTGTSFALRREAGGSAPTLQGITASYAGQLPVGRQVEVRLRTGEKFKATLMGVEGDSVRVQRSGRLPVPPQLIPLDDLSSLRLSEGGGTSAGKALALGIAAGAATFFGLFLLSIAAWAD